MFIPMERRKVMEARKHGEIALPKEILDVTKMTKRFQTTVPKIVREVLDINNKDRIIWILDNGEIKIQTTWRKGDL